MVFLDVDKQNSLLYDIVTQCGKKNRRLFDHLFTVHVVPELE